MSAADFVSRIKSNWRMKLALGSVVTLGFTAVYVVLQRFPLFSVTQVKMTWMDQLIPFAPGAVYLYESLWLIMPLSFWLTDTMEELRQYAFGFLFISLVGFVIFFFYPTATPRPGGFDHANTVYLALIRLDKELNAFPSLHAALAVYSGSCCHALFRTNRWQTGNLWMIWAWVLGIIFSTLLTKQHTLMDVVAGAVLGLGSYAICWRNKREAGLRA